MLHVSTRGTSSAVSSIGFCDAVLAGLAPDGGLYLPEIWPSFTQERILGLAGKPYADIAKTIIGTFADGEIPVPILHKLIDDAYATFRHPAVCPLVQLDDNLFFLELFHGPTLAFKDVAMQVLARLMDYILELRGERATIIGATSGDTGSAAIEAFRYSKRVDVFILYPHGRVSEVQRRQMTTIEAPNIHALAIDGSFDDAQALVKAMFNHASFRKEVALSGVNSINWARIVSQIVYFFTSALSLGGPLRPVSFSVPTGNFGDILAGYVAKKMGLPIRDLMIATNANDILVRTLKTGIYDIQGVRPTLSPSMDIQVSSNFERVLFDACDRQGDVVRGFMNSLAQSRSFTLSEHQMLRIRADFKAHAVSEEATLQQIKDIYRRTGYVLDPHSAIAVNAAYAIHGATPVIALGTAHPAKFPDAVERATGLRPALPPHLGDLFERREYIHSIANDQMAIETFIRQRIGH